jgi:hypothetical protein
MSTGNLIEFDAWPCIQDNSPKMKKLHIARCALAPNETAESAT